MHRQDFNHLDVLWDLASLTTAAHAVGAGAGLPQALQQPLSMGDDSSDDEVEISEPDTYSPLTELRKAGLICATEARRNYGLNDKQLSQLPCQRHHNPFHRNGAPLRLYAVTAVEQLTEVVKAMKDYNTEHAGEIAAAKKEAQKEAAKQAKEATAAFSLAPANKKTNPGTSPLDSSVWELILTHLTDDCNLGGLRGPSTVARDIAHAALVWPEAREAAPAAWKALADKCKAWSDGHDASIAAVHAAGAAESLPKLPDGIDWAGVNVVISQPQALNLPALKTTARQLKIKLTGTKAELILRLLAAFGLTAPSRVDSILLWWVLDEKRSFPSVRIVQQVYELREAGFKGGDTLTWFSTRKDLLEQYRSVEGVERAVKAAHEAAKQKAAEIQRLRQAERAANLAKINAAVRLPDPDIACMCTACMIFTCT